MNEVVQKLAEQKAEHVARLEEWLRIPSVSTDSARKEDVRKAGEWVRDELSWAGFETRIEETAGHPVVVAKWHGARGAPTVLVYGHYDVQPPEPLDLWRHGPFEPTVEGDNLIARGATDDKGQVLALIRGIGGVLREKGSLPINVTFLVEGEEEIGSPNLTPFIEAHAEELSADVALISDTSQFAPGVPALTIGLKGLVYLQVELVGPNRDLHSGSFGGAVANPGNVLATMLASLKDSEGRVLIPGFYDDVRDLSEAERAEIAALPFDEAGFCRDLELEHLHGEKGYSTLERKWARPTLDVNGMLCGWTGEGAKTVLPSKAMAKFSMRLVPDQDSETIRRQVTDHLRRICPPTCKLTVHCDHGAEPVLVERTSPWLVAAERAVEKGFGTKPVYIREGGSIPVVSEFKKILGIDTILLGTGLPDDNAHSPNEKFCLSDFQRAIETAAWLLDEMIRMENPDR
ncbi:MAG TPA: dipeptidase [Planctomycetes bacterium]|nr:dipeptidase [Planctomycetota bacterium]HIN80694.1 dipeptidase [Planctomycetota bacterium]